ncbi:MAG: protein kinase [Desulfocapsaceae bacterium]|nr:protein kinase [Desulfocapsaceae bacterium]
MGEICDRRGGERVSDNESGLGWICLPGPGKVFQLDKLTVSDCCFVGIRNLSDSGMMLEVDEPLAVGTLLVISRHDFRTGDWRSSAGTVVWCKQIRKQYYCLGVNFRSQNSSSVMPSLVPPRDNFHIIEHLPFLLHSDLLKSVPKNAIWSLLNCIRPCRFEAGERIFSQGDPGDCFYLIEEGRCRVHCLKDGNEHLIAVLNLCDVVGEMAVLTGENRLVHIDAEIDSALWRIDREAYGRVAELHPELRLFLTEQVTKRFEVSGHFADKMIGKYTVRHKLGNGAWAIVFSGEHQLLKKPVAIKMLKHTMAMDVEFKEKFSQEGEIIARMNHPNVVQVYDIESRFNTTFIIMELLNGESLESRLKREGALPFDVAARYLHQTCSALAYAHDTGIIHQDIKPDNLFICNDDSLKVVDFGLACASGSENFEMEGTLFYMSPEQINSDPVDARTDIYCMGITAYEMVAGRRPYPENDLGRLMERHVEEDIPDPALAVPGIPESLRAFIIKACQRDPANRYQSMTDALVDLEPLCGTREHTGISSLVQPRCHMSSMHFFYQDEHRKEVTQLFEEFHSRARELGVITHLADFENFQVQ